MIGDGITGLRVVAVTDEQDVFALRRDAQTIAEAAGADRQDRIRLATALSELGRDRLGSIGLTVRFALAAAPAPALEVTVRWTDGPPPGTEALESAQRLIRELSSRTLGHGGSVVLRQPVSLAPEDFAAAAERLAGLLTDTESADREDDLRAQTRDLILALEDTSGHWGVAVIGRNVTNRVSADLAGPDPDPSYIGSWVESPEALRSVLLSGWFRR